MKTIDINKLYNPKNDLKEKSNTKIDEILEQEEILYVISKKIILYRKSKKLTQRQLAKKLEVNQTMISKLESGNYNPTFKQIYRITRKLTNSSDLYREILQEIIEKLNKYNSIINFSANIENEDIYDLKNMYENSDETNIIYLNIGKENYSIKKGEKINGKYKGKISIVG